MLLGASADRYDQHAAHDPVGHGPTADVFAGQRRPSLLERLTRSGGRRVLLSGTLEGVGQVKPWRPNTPPAEAANLGEALGMAHDGMHGNMFG